MKMKWKGSITVFISLIMIVVLALVGTLIDLARFQVSKSFVDRGTLNALETEFTKYNKELYEDYHIFLMEQNKDINAMDANEFLTSIQDYLLYSFDPNQCVTVLGKEIPVDSYSLLDIQVEDCSIDDTVMITDYKGSLFLDEVKQYMKYQVGADGIKELFSKTKAIDSSKSAMRAVTKKLETEEKVAKMSKKVIELIEEVEGLLYKDGQLSVTEDYFINTKGSFAKKFCAVEPSPYNVAIDKNIVWDSLEGKYINPVDVMKEMKRLCEKRKQGENTAKNLKELTDKKKDLCKNAKSIVKNINRSIELIGDIKRNQIEVEAEITSYEAVLNEEKDNMEPDVYSGMKEELQDMKGYVNRIDNETGVDTSVIGNIISMENCLKKNKGHMESLLRLDEISILSTEKPIEKIEDLIDELIIEFGNYSIRPLKFDYSTLTVEPKQESPINVFQGLISDGIFSLIIEEEGLSKETISKDNFPSQSLVEQKGTENNMDPEELADAIQDSSEEENCVADHLDGYNKEGEAVESGKEEMVDQVLLCEYVVDHFKNYRNKDTKKIEKETVLECEQEYILFQKESDYENLKSAAMKMIFYRTVFNYLYLLSDSTSRMKAKSTATAMVGFTGMAPLILVTEHLILITWSLEESLVDTRALLVGKEVPLLKTKKTFQIQYQELLLISKELIQKKVEGIPAEQKGTIGLTYEDYIRIFLIMEGKEKIIYNTMDVIQLNMQKRYNKEFFMKNCIFGIGVTVNCSIEDKFLSIPSIEAVTHYGARNHSIMVQKEYSY